MPARHSSTGRARAPPAAAAGSKTKNAPTAIVLAIACTQTSPRQAHFTRVTLLSNACAARKLHFSIVTGDSVLLACGAWEFKLCYGQGAYRTLGLRAVGARAWERCDVGPSGRFRARGARHHREVGTHGRRRDRS